MLFVERVHDIVGDLPCLYGTSRAAWLTAFVSGAGARGRREIARGGAGGIVIRRPRISEL